MNPRLRICPQWRDDGWGRHGKAVGHGDFGGGSLQGWLNRWATEFSLLAAAICPGDRLTSLEVAHASRDVHGMESSWTVGWAPTGLKDWRIDGCGASLVKIVFPMSLS